MAEDPKINRQLRKLQQLPPDFLGLASWGWGELRAAIDARVRRLDVDPISSAQIAARVARLVCTEILTDVKLYRLPKR